MGRKDRLKGRRFLTEVKMKTKKLMILIMSIVMAFGMMMFFSACTETDQQQDAEQEQTTVAEEGESVEPDAAAPEEDAEETANAVNEYVNLAGEYQDETSGRAAATVIANTEAKCVNITVIWSSSATESTEWTMSAVKEGNQLVYSDCTKRTTFASEDLDEEEEGDEDGMGGGAEETVEYEGGSGSFEISEDGKLLWTGAADEDCTGCVFVKLTE